MKATILQAERITKTYQVGKTTGLKVLKGVALTLLEGEFLAIMGSSGSGKSTLLHILGALDAPTDGRVVFRGQSVFDLPEQQRDVLRCQRFGFVYQFYHLLPELNVFENALFPQLIQFSALEWLRQRRAAKQRCRQVLEQVGLQARLKHKPNELSGGEQQRVAIARALANRPAILLADEPTGNLDKKTGTEVLGLLQNLHRAGQTVIMVTHDAAVAQAADRTVRLEDGKLVDAA